MQNKQTNKKTENMQTDKQRNQVNIWTLCPF